MKIIKVGTNVVYCNKIAKVIEKHTTHVLIEFEDKSKLCTPHSSFPDDKILDEFEIMVWFRYVIAGEQEKEYDIHKIAAVDVQDAVNKAELLYPSRARIPFAYYHNEIKYQPQN